MSDDVWGGAVEAAAKAIYDSWWEGSEQFEEAHWENLDPDDCDRVSALKAARIAFDTGLPMVADEIRDAEIEVSRTGGGSGAAMYRAGMLHAADIVRSFASEVSR